MPGFPDRYALVTATYIEPGALHPRRAHVRHAPFAIGQAARERWLKLMNRALEEAAFPDEPRKILQSFFESTTHFAEPGGRLID